MPEENMTEPKMSERGFAGFGPIDGTYPATSVSAYESSAAFNPSLWLNIAVMDSELAVHLTLEDAATLRDQITWLIDNHYQIKDRTQEHSGDDVAAAGSSCYRLPTLDKYDRIKAASEDPDGGAFDENDLHGILAGQVVDDDYRGCFDDVAESEGLPTYSLIVAPVAVDVLMFLGLAGEDGAVYDDAKKASVPIEGRTTREVADLVIAAARGMRA